MVKLIESHRNIQLHNPESRLEKQKHYCNNYHLLLTTTLGGLGLIKTTSEFFKGWSRKMQYTFHFRTLIFVCCFVVIWCGPFYPRHLGSFFDYFTVSEAFIWYVTVRQPLKNVDKHIWIHKIWWYYQNKATQNKIKQQQQQNISMAQCKTEVTPLLMHWSYCSLALSRGYTVL